MPSRPKKHRDMGCEYHYSMCVITNTKNSFNIFSLLFFQHKNIVLEMSIAPHPYSDPDCTTVLYT